MFGGGTDLQIFHTGSVGEIGNFTGNLNIKSNGFRVFNGGATQAYITADQNSSVSIAFSGTNKLSTTGYGVTVFGTTETQSLYATGITTSVGKFHIRPSSGALSPKISYVDSIADAMIWADNVEARFGGSSDFRIYHETPGDLNIIETHLDREIHIREVDGTNIAKFIPGGSVELYENGTKRLETTNTGVSITDNLNVAGISTLSGKVKICLLYTSPSPRD